MKPHDKLNPEEMAQYILTRLGELRAGHLLESRQQLALPELEALARHYLLLARNRPRANDVGQIFVTRAAARAYAEYEGLQEEEARRELTELLIDAARVEGGERTDGPQRWRLRGGRTGGLDLQAQVSVEGRLLVVVGIRVREDRDRRGGGTPGPRGKPRSW